MLLISCVFCLWFIQTTPARNPKQWFGWEDVWEDAWRPRGGSLGWEPWEARGSVGAKKSWEVSSFFVISGRDRPIRAVNGGYMSPFTGLCDKNERPPPRADPQTNYRHSLAAPSEVLRTPQRKHCSRKNADGLRVFMERSSLCSIPYRRVRAYFSSHWTSI